MAWNTLAARSSDDDNKGPDFLILTCVLTALSVTTTGLRYFARTYKRSLGWDDHLILITSILTLPRTGLQIASVGYGNGRHAKTLTEAQNQWVVMHGWYTQLLLFPTLCLLKCSICFLLLRIKNTRRTRNTLFGIMALLVITNLEPLIILLSECTPKKTYWDKSAGNCWNPKIRIYSIYGQIAYSTLTDLICALMPMYVVWKVQMSRRNKYLLCGLMSLGLVATVCAVVRASSLGLKTTDIAYDYCIVAMWANSELHLGIIAANMACSKNVYSVLRYGRNLPTKTQTGGSGNGYRSNSGYTRSKDVTADTYHKSTISTTRSQKDRMDDDEDHDDVIPLRDGITKVTEYSVKSAPNGSSYDKRDAATKWLAGKKSSGH